MSKLCDAVLQLMATVEVHGSQSWVDAIGQSVLERLAAEPQPTLAGCTTGTLPRFNDSEGGEAGLSSKEREGEALTGRVGAQTAANSAAAAATAKDGGADDSVGGATQPPPPPPPQPPTLLLREPKPKVRRFTAAQLASLAWALGEKGGLAARNPGWAAAVAAALSSRLPAPAGNTRSREICHIARRVQNVPWIADVIKGPLVAAFCEGLEFHSNPANHCLPSDGSLSSYAAVLHTAICSGLFASVEALPPVASATFIGFAQAASWTEVNATLKFMQENDFFLAGSMLVALTTAVEKRLHEAAAQSATADAAAAAAAAYDAAAGLAATPGRDPSGNGNAAATKCVAAVVVVGATIPFEKLARTAELICATNTSSAASAAAVASLALDHVAAASPQASHLDPKLMAMWCLQMAAAGVEERAVFDAVAEVIVAKCEAGSNGKKRGGKGRWIPESSPPLQSWLWLAKVATLLASAGLRDHAAFRRIAAVAAATPESDELASLALQATSAEQLAEMQQWHFRRIRAFAEMRDGTFGYFSQLPMLLTHKADCSMHGQMTSAALPAGWDSPAAVAARLAAAIAAFDDPTLPVAVDFGCGRGSFLLRLATAATPAASAPATQTSTSQRCNVDATNTACVAESGAGGASKMTGLVLLPSKVNFLGVERAPFLVRKARGLAARWGVSGRLQFVAGSAEAVVARWHELETAPLIELACLQFPTPFTSSNRGGAKPKDGVDGGGGDGGECTGGTTVDHSGVADAGVAAAAVLAATPTAAATAVATVAAERCGDGSLKLNFESTHNSHLPTASAGFLASASLAKQLPSLLSPTGKVFLQTNTEDVAVAMRKVFEADSRLCVVEGAACGYSADAGAGVGASAGVGLIDAGGVDGDGDEPVRRSLRSSSWVARGGASADGAGWLPGNPWGDSCDARTETEVWCEAERFRVYRCALRLRKQIKCKP